MNKDLAEKVDRKFNIVKGERGPLQMFNDFGFNSQDYMEEKVLNEFLTNSEDAHTRAIKICNNLKSLPEELDWAHIIENAASLRDFGIGVGGKTRKEYNKNQFRFSKGFGWGKDSDSTHANVQGRYGKGLKKNIIEFCSAYIAISKHKYDIEDEKFTVVMGKTIGKPETATIDCTWKGKSQTPIFTNAHEKKQQEFMDFMSEYTPIEHNHLKQLDILHKHFFPGDDDTGVVYLFFGTRRKITKENMTKKFNNLYYERPVDEKGQLIEDYHVTFNGERLPLDFYSEKTTLLYSKTFQPFESNGYYACKKMDGTRPRTKHNKKKYMQHEGKEMKITIDIVRHYEPYFNAHMDHQIGRPELTATCGNHIKRFTLKSLLKGSTSTMYKIISDVLGVHNTLTQDIWNKIDRSKCCDGKDGIYASSTMERFGKLPRLGQKIEMIIRLPARFYDVLKNDFDKNRRPEICMCLTSGIQTIMPFFNGICSELTEDDSFKQTWGKWETDKKSIVQWEKVESRPPCVDMAIIKQKAVVIKQKSKQKTKKRKRNASNKPTDSNVSLSSSSSSSSSSSDTPQNDMSDSSSRSPDDSSSDTPQNDMSDGSSRSSDEHTSDTPPPLPLKDGSSSDNPSDTPPLKDESDGSSSDNSSDTPTPQPNPTKRRKGNRKEFLSSQKDKAWDAQGGFCANPNCGCKLSASSNNGDHKDGNASNNSQENLHILCLSCHNAKTQIECACRTKKIKFEYGMMETDSVWLSRHLRDIDMLMRSEPRLNEEQQQQKKNLIVKWFQKLE